MQPIYDIPFQNVSGETIPAFAAMKCSVDDNVTPRNAAISIEGQVVLLMIKPDQVFERVYYLNGPTAVPANGFGMCTVADRGALALVEPGASAPERGTIGPRPGHWGLYPGGLGFMTLASEVYWSFGRSGDGTALATPVRQDILSPVIGRLDSIMYGHGVFTLNLIGPSDGETPMQVHGIDVGLLSDTTTLDAGRLVWAFYSSAGWTFGGAYPALGSTSG